MCPIDQKGGTQRIRRIFDTPRNNETPRNDQSRLLQIAERIQRSQKSFSRRSIHVAKFCLGNVCSLVKKKFWKKKLNLSI